MNHVVANIIIVFLAPALGGYLEKHYGWWSWVENRYWFLPKAVFKFFEHK